MPMSSQSRYSSSTSSKRSAAIFGSQCLFGRLPRTESAALRTSWGTNGYGFSLRYQACIAYSFRNAASRSANASGCSTCGWWPAPGIASKRAPGISAAYARP